MKPLLLALGLMLLVACAAPVTTPASVDPALMDREKAHQLELVQRESRELETRLEWIGYRLLSANADLCQNHTGPFYGATSRYVAVPLDSVEGKVQQQVWGIKGASHTVVKVTPGGPGDKAGVKVGDIVRSMNGAKVVDGKAGAEVTKAQFEATVGARAPWKLEVEREGALLPITVEPEIICSVKTLFVRDDRVNAWAKDGKTYVTTALMRATNDDEFALVLAHELAHTVYDHNEKKGQNQFLGAILGGMIGAGQAGARIGGMAYSQDFEAEADYVGIILAARAGFDVRKAAEFFRRMATLHPSAIHAKESASHPSTVKRFLAVEAAINEIERKRAAGLPLVPEIKAQ